MTTPRCNVRFAGVAAAAAAVTFAVALITRPTRCSAVVMLSVSFSYVATRPTFQSVGDESICLFTLGHRSAGAAVGLRDRPRAPSSVRVQGSIGRSQETGRVRICRPWVVHGAVSSEAVCVRLARGSVPSPVLSCVCRHVVPGTPRARTAVDWR